MTIKYITMNDRTYTVFFDNGQRREISAMVRTANGQDRLVSNPVTLAKAAAIAIDMLHAEALEINAQISAVTPAQAKAADIIADVKRRCALYGFAGQAVKFSVIDRADRFGIHFTTAGGEDITGFAHFRDREEMAEVINELRRILGDANGGYLLRSQEAN